MIHLPQPIRVAIGDHLREGGNTAHRDWDAGHADEDTLTGHLGSRIQRDWSGPYDLDDGQWYWRVVHTKFRGRGPGAFERTAGADAIVQIEVGSRSRLLTSQKGILYQAKKADVRPGPLKTQAEDMEQIAPSSSAVVTYDPEQYTCIAASHYLQEHRTKLIFSREGPLKLGDFLADRFVACSTGLEGLYYDAVRKILVVPDLQNGARLIPVEIGHRIIIGVDSP